ncbi:MAG: hypothetical protein ACREV5_13895 [Steroidobacter sp.]
MKLPLTLLLLVCPTLLNPALAHGSRDGYEVWLVDQSNSRGTTWGGAIHIFDERLLKHVNARRSAPEVIDLGARTTELCLQATGAAPVRPHMLTFNTAHTHAVLSFVASGHVVFFDARRRTPVACLRTELGAGGVRQAHAAWPTTDNQYVLVANQNGKKLERIATDYRGNAFTQEPQATLDLANCTTPNGVACQLAGVRPDNAPICPYTASDNGPAFISLRGGGMFVVDWLQTPMQIIGSYDAAHVPANGCGFIEARGWIYANGGGATANNLDQFAVYRVPMSGFLPSNPVNTPAAELLMNDASEHRDAHGVAVTGHERYVWMGDRARNVVEVFHSDTGVHVNTIDLVSSFSQDPTPDLFDLSPDKQLMFMSLRGPVPLSGDPHSSTGGTPGLLVMKITQAGRHGIVKRVLRISNVDAAGVERADAHGIRVRRTRW